MDSVKDMKYKCIFSKGLLFQGRKLTKKKNQKNPKTNNHTLQMKDLKAIKLCI